MKKLRLQFLLFFILLQSGILFLLFNSYRQMKIEEISLWEAESTKVYNQMQLQVSDLLNLEDARSFREYRYFQSQEHPSNKSKMTRSSLAEVSDLGFPKGWIGYFQIDPDGSFSTPYLPLDSTVSKSLGDYELRRKKQESLSQATQIFRKEMKGAFANRSLSEQAPKTGTTGNVLPIIKSRSQVNVYPNPILQSTEASKVLEQNYPVNDQTKSALPSLARREEAAPEQSVKTFAQSTIPSKMPTKEDKRIATGVAQDEKNRKRDNYKESEALPSAEGSSGFREQVEEVKPRGASNTSVLRKVKPKTVVSADTANSLVWLDPFQAKVSQQNLIFFRRVWVEQKMYLQGFVIDTQAYFTGLMQNSFENSNLPQFSQARWFSEDKSIARYGDIKFSSSPILFSQTMAYPLSNVQWEILGKAWPKISTRMYMNILFGGIFFFASFGLYWIYRSSAAQIRLSQKRQDFVAAVTHELKTPLTSIRMYSEMLGDNWVSDESKKKEYYKNIQQESERLSRLIENVLQMARLEKQSYRLNPLKQNPSADFQNWAIQFVELASKEGFQFHLQLEANLPEIKYDPEALKEVLLILLENSVKFSRQASNKNLELNIKVRASNLEVIWRDYGPGVPSKESSQIFEKFYRVENELTRKTKGTGIGLAIAKMMIEEMGAKIEARNGNPTGLELVIRFPV